MGTHSALLTPSSSSCLAGASAVLSCSGSGKAGKHLQSCQALQEPLLSLWDGVFKKGIWALSPFCWQDTALV